MSDEAGHRAAELIRTVTRVFLDPDSGALAAIETAVLDGAGEPFRSDPALSEEVLASVRENVLHWAHSVMAAPMEPVAPSPAPAVLAIVREGVRRGAERNMRSAYHAGGDQMLREWMRLAFESDPPMDLLPTVLDSVSRSLGGWIGATVDHLGELFERELAELTRGSYAQRFETVAMILDGALGDASSAATRLGYRFEGSHVGAVLWTDAGSPDRLALGRVVDSLRDRIDPRRFLSVAATSSSQWVWAGGGGDVLSTDGLVRALRETPGVRCAIGSPADGIDGFRRSHHDAVETQRLMLRTPTVQAASFDDVALVILATTDEQAAREFVSRTLGRLAQAPPELRETLRVHIRTMFSVSATAKVLFAHRNTVQNRIRRAEALLPEPLSRRGLEVGAALEVSRWLA